MFKKKKLFSRKTQLSHLLTNITFLLFFPYPLQSPKKDWPNTPKEAPNPQHVCGFIVRGSYIIYKNQLFQDDKTEKPGAVAELILRYVAYAAAAGRNFIQEFTKKENEPMEQYTVRQRKPKKNQTEATNPAYSCRATMKAQLLHLQR